MAGFLESFARPFDFFTFSSCRLFYFYAMDFAYYSSAARGDDGA
jgi:hypothetical protein